LTVGEIAEVLTEEVRSSSLVVLFPDLMLTCNLQNAVAWRAITNLISIGEIPELTEMDEEKEAAVLFGRVHGIGPSRAKEL
jgi:hypothetical protein